MNPHFMQCLKEEINMENKEIYSLLKNVPIIYDPEIIFKNYQSIFYYQPKIKKFDYIAAFDLDWTLSYNEKHLFPKDPEDIKILPNRRRILEDIVKLGYTLVIFTNQYSKSKSEKLKKVERVSNFMKELKLPVNVYIATEKDEYRKPEIGMWNFFVNNLKTENNIKEIKKVIFVGDALGRPQDFSDSDRKFAENFDIIDTKIYTPEDFFGSNKNSKPLFILKDKKELIIFVGMPGCGKSTYYSGHLSDYIHLEQDKIGNRNKLVKEFHKSLKTGLSIVIDSTNPSQEIREEYYKEAQKYNYNIKVLYFTVDGHGYNKLREKPVPDVVYHIYFKKLVPPTEENTPGEVIHIF
jgi:bifunctional polynucleotide phosphatase/kinase